MHMLFAAGASSAAAMGRRFTPLASLTWTTVAMAYLRELDNLQAWRAENLRPPPPKNPKHGKAPTRHSWAGRDPTVSQYVWHNDQQWCSCVIR